MRSSIRPGRLNNANWLRKGSSAERIFRARLTAMPGEASKDITGLLAAWSNGEEDALSDLMLMVYPELRRIARKHLASGFPAQSLESAALVNEAYLKLIRGRGIAAKTGCSSLHCARKSSGASSWTMHATADTLSEAAALCRSRSITRGLAHVCRESNCWLSMRRWRHYRSLIPAKVGSWSCGTSGV